GHRLVGVRVPERLGAVADVAGAAAVHVAGRGVAGAGVGPAVLGDGVGACRHGLGAQGVHAARDVAPAGGRLAGHDAPQVGLEVEGVDGALDAVGVGDGADLAAVPGAVGATGADGEGLVEGGVRYRRRRDVDLRGGDLEARHAGPRPGAAGGVLDVEAVGGEAPEPHRLVVLLDGLAFLGGDRHRPVGQVHVGEAVVVGLQAHRDEL